MNPVLFGVVAGLLFGLVDVLLMIPFQLPDKRTAMIGAFLSRFAIGFLIPLCKLPAPMIVTGIVVALLISLPDAVITKAYVPILVVGAIVGALIGWLSGRYT